MGFETTARAGSNPPDASLVPGVTYVLGYQASSNVPLSTFRVQVSAAVPHYTETDFDVTTDVPVAALQRFKHSFSLTAPDAQAGLLNLYYGIYSGLATVCLDNVSLRTGS